MRVIALDPGLTTGWAVVDSPDAIVDCGNWSEDDLEWALPAALSALTPDEAVVEVVPPGVHGPLAHRLEAVRDAIARALRGRVVTGVQPGTWKTSATAANAAAPREWDGQHLTAHQRDAVTMARWRIKEVESRGQG